MPQDPPRRKRPRQHRLYASPAHHVTLTEDRRAFLAEAQRERFIPVLLTRSDATISEFMADALWLAGGTWACKTRNGNLYDATSGYRIHQLPELWLNHDTTREQLPHFTPPPDERYEKGIFFDAYIRHRPDDSVIIGRVTQHLLSSLPGPGQGAAPQRWSTTEPASTPWKLQRITDTMREQMPLADRILITGQGNIAATTNVARTAQGLLENTRGLIPLGTGSPPPATKTLAAHPAITSALSRLCEEFRVTIALITERHITRSQQGELLRRIEPRHPNRPLAALIGPHTVRQLRLNLNELAQRHDISYIGPNHSPGVLLRFTGNHEPHEQMHAFLRELDPERLAAAITRQPLR